MIITKFGKIAGSSKYVITSPLFEKVTLKLENSILEINAYNVSSINIYIEKCLINGQLYNDPFIDHSILVKGNTKIEFFMTNKPTKWGTK